MRKRGKSFAVWLYGLMLFWGMGGSARAGELTINGSTTILPFAQVAVERFMASRPEVRISLSGGGTGNGIKALIDGTADIANASRAIRQGEAERARGKGVNPVRFVVALDCIVPIVHPGNPVRSLTLDQLKKIYTGEIVNWKEVGGEDAPIAAVGRDSSSGTYGTWQEMVVERGDVQGRKSRVAARTQVVASSGAMVGTVAGNRFAIGYDGIGYVDDTIRALSVEGVAPSAENAKAGRYPLSRELYMYTAGEPAGDAKSFIDYMLSQDGQRIVEDEGFIPVSR
ncbi:phosphate ABC transporter substrate-binding protein [Fretibacterium sp. OH1220_COT-178]|uniref:phosphate ABC transporter substrate-binding protein n=1 Tax=Fretibacterium sp. OH1220_COT-178 TaxID=2491047 RepID=UPI000F5D75D8|nr:phosphate ABC transporter substrate-binding protein [Fretibacterium sp. OH1220_COT-178]RRD63712.1 phosphate ABC transporter substrate-binding protein [Fretibacterium sp. OH1220_COT-178]